MTTHPALTPGRMAVITGAASGIGLATAKRMASLGLRVCLVDIDEATLDTAKAELSAISRNGGLGDLAVSADVSDPVAVAKVKDQVRDILCPHNDVSRDMDEKRIQWAADDIIKNRPALSRWQPDYEAEFASFMAQLPHS